MAFAGTAIKAQIGKKLMERGLSKDGKGLDISPQNIIASRVDKRMQDRNIGGALGDSKAGKFIAENSTYQKTPQQVAALQGEDFFKTSGQMTIETLTESVNAMDPEKRAELFRMLSIQFPKPDLSTNQQNILE